MLIKTNEITGYFTSTNAKKTTLAYQNEVADTCYKPWKGKDGLLF